MAHIAQRIRLLVSSALVAGLAVVPLAAQSPTGQQQQDRELQRFEHRQEFLRQEEKPAPNVTQAATTPCVAGMAGTYPCQLVDLVSFTPLSAIGGGNGNDIWGWTDPLDGKEYAIMGRTSGTSFVDITDPENPVYLGNLPPNGANSTWRDIKVYSNHAYIVSEAFNHGMQIFDLKQLRNVLSPPVTFSETALFTGFGSAHNVAINEDTGFAYAVGTGSCGGGPYFVDITTPASPVDAGCHVETIYTHDTQCVIYAGPDTDHQGKEICVNSNEDKFNIVDVTDHANSSLISTTTYTGARYTHQGWLTEDHTYWLQGDELDEQNLGHNTRTYIFDVSDLDNPVQIGTYDGPTEAIDHNLYTHNGYAYEANYRAGLRILDLAQVSSGILTEIAYFDIYPSSDSASFNGAWSVYPYFASGNVVVSGREQGLFVLRPQLAPDFQVDVSPTTLSVCDPGDATANVTLTDRNGYVGNVTLSTVGLPAGAVDSYSNSPLAVPGASDLTIDTSGVATGSYPFDLSATDGTLTNDVSMILEVSGAIPGVPLPTAPTDGAVDVSRAPTLSWAAATDAFSYQVEIASDAGFNSIVASTTTAATSFAVPTSLGAGTLHYWRVRAVNGCGNGADSAVSQFTTLTVPRILLVDDDDNGPDMQPNYDAILTALGEDYDVWDTQNSDDEPSALELAPYEVVIWFTGDEFGGSAGPGGAGETALAGWLDSSRCLLISSQDYYWDRGLSSLMTSHLGVSAATSDVSQSSADGQGTVFTGLGPYTLSYPYTNYSDELTPDGSAEAAFNGSQGISAVDKDTGLYRTSYWAFGLETLPNATDRETALSTFLGWCAALANEDGDTDGTDNGLDCAPGDPTLWSAPSPARDLLVERTDMNWQAPSNPGGTTPLYDVVRSEAPADFGSGVCIEPGETDTTAADVSTPALNGLYCYLVRAHNACGATLGDDSQPAPRGGASTCP